MSEKINPEVHNVDEEYETPFTLYAEIVDFSKKIEIGPGSFSDEELHNFLSVNQDRLVALIDSIDTFSAYPERAWA